MEPHKLVVGLGNPGPEYVRTRHNVGWIVVDALAERWGVGDWRKKWNARYAVDRGRGVALLEPQSYMNLSGGPTQAALTFFKIPPVDALVVVDDLDLPFGRLRIRERGSHGGHNGLRDIIARVGDGFPRLRIGIGRDARGAIGHVLGRFSDDEERALAGIVDAAVEAIELWTTRGATAAQNHVNGLVLEA